VDILTLGENVALGTGWYHPEAYGNGFFRWMSPHAELYVAAVQKAKYFLQIYLEPFPDVNEAPFELLIEEDGKPLDRVPLRGRQMISLQLPAAQPAVRKLDLRLQTHRDEPAKGPQLDLRVFKIVFFAPPVDIVPSEIDARIGSGWYSLETFGGETFRWANNDAQLILAEPPEGGELRLDIAPGPGVDYAPFSLRVYSGERLLTQVEITQRQWVPIPLKKENGQLTLTLRVEGGGKRLPTDHRVMNFRAFVHSANLPVPETERAASTRNL
jgi:hypothetical protein